MALKQTQISKMVSPNKGLKIWAEHLISLSILQIKHHGIAPVDTRR